MGRLMEKVYLLENHEERRVDGLAGLRILS